MPVPQSELPGDEPIPPPPPPPPLYPPPHPPSLPQSNELDIDELFDSAILPHIQQEL
ncbi:hypothetical protein PAXRUDRAFT_18130 [Paxillus rubicundulus Ve08.2h10]|uniref:Uncharacterized protein n=1 Tax=Paxillus rubicundulus Ve08.2h10 TaxID=930991 RepID=A0A0D0DFK7_9AGAM|nr:hypothetical protein PAXRUDRAFT_18130 [Paxillus rubicundulus Ve08.2h10]